MFLVRQPAGMYITVVESVDCFRMPENYIYRGDYG